MSATQKMAVVLVNLGTPDTPDAPAVRRFLREFLSDARVIEGKGPRRWLWLTILNTVVLAFRPAKVAKLYRSIWQEDSPMRQILNEQVTKLQLRLNARNNASVSVFGAMTYGNPGLTERLNTLQQHGYQRVLVVPLYPQYSATTTAPIYDRIAAFQQNRREVLDIRVIKAFQDHPLYIEALANSVRQFWHTNGQADKLLLSYHGIPQEYADKGDPYPEHCEATSTQLVKALALADTQWQMSYQSRFGPTQWLQPYTGETLKQLAARIKSVDVICPAFTADCLETLEEIAVENRDTFTEAGGEQYRYIPALNANDAFINLLEALVQEQAGDWLVQEPEDV